MRLVLLAGLAVVAIAVFAPNEGAGLMRSVVNGFGWGIGREVAHNMFGHHLVSASVSGSRTPARPRAHSRSERRSGRRPPKRTQRQFPAGRAT